MNAWVFIYRLSWWIIALLLLVFVAFRFSPRIRIWKDYQHRKAALEESNRLKAEKVQDYQERQERFQHDPAYVKTVAHEAGMVMPGEAVFRDETQSASNIIIDGVAP